MTFFDTKIFLIEHCLLSKQTHRPKLNFRGYLTFDSNVIILKLIEFWHLEVLTFDRFHIYSVFVYVLLHDVKILEGNFLTL